MVTRPTAVTTPDDVRVWRRKLGLTQAQAGEKIGLSQRSIDGMESGRQPVTLTAALAMRAVERGLKPLGAGASEKTQ